MTPRSRMAYTRRAARRGKEKIVATFDVQTSGELIPDATREGGLARRTLLRIGAAGTAVAAAGVGKVLAEPNLATRGLLTPDGVFGAASMAWSGAVYTEVYPTSPLILNPFTDAFVKPEPLRPTAPAVYGTWGTPPGPNQQSSVVRKDGSLQTHQIWNKDVRVGQSDDPLVYEINVLVSTHRFTSSQVLPINSLGQPTTSFDAAGKLVPAGKRDLPASVIYGFNGTFPGPMINAEYGRACLVRFSNHLDQDTTTDVQDFGAPDRSFLTHLHNGHTAPESDGNPHYSMQGLGLHGYTPGSWCDNLYLNWPAGSDDREKQSFFWFHDHRMDHTGSNVYKGMVGIYPIYDPKDYNLTSAQGNPGRFDAGQETEGLGLPGRRTDNGDGSFSVDYDIPFVLYDTRLDDGVTIHKDIHDTQNEFPKAGNPRTHPEWWGKTFYKHFPNHGFVGDIFTVNGVAYPVLNVYRRKYRFRFLDASVSRIYELKLMSSKNGPKAAKDLGLTLNELQGQYRIPDGQQCMKFTQIASDGGLLPQPIVRDSFELWPAKRREFIVDFTKYQDGTSTTPGDVVYLTDVMKMPDGRMWTNSSRFSPDPAYKVPLVKIVIGDLPEKAGLPKDESVIPAQLRALPPLPANWKDLLANRLIFEVQRGSAGGELEWLINGHEFDPAVVTTSLKNPAGKTPLAQQKMNSFNLWEIRNGGGGWVHPFHLHMEEHRTVMRNNKDVTAGNDKGHPDDVSKEDLGALDPSESVIIYRGFRDFVGPYVAHCHNLAHEDHAMMFGWEIVP
jgi:FtsP/CotA-like multicopper oxidase with cupredoxin domain